jgi:Flp pilus assembly protein CpaB
MPFDLGGAARALSAVSRPPVRASAILARRRWPTIAAAATAAAVLGSATVSSLRAVDAERARWGETAPAVRVRHDLAVGDAIGPDDVEWVSWPRAVLPVGALDEPPIGALARRPVGEGEVLTHADVTATGPLSLVPTGWRAVVVRRDTLTGLPVGPGDRLEVVAAGRVLAPGVLVAVGDGAALVAVPAEAAPAVADAGLLGDAALVWVPPS